MSQRYCAQCKNESSRMTSVKCVNLRTFWRISWGIVWGIVYFKFYPRGFSFSTFDYRYFKLITIFTGKYKLLEHQKCPHNPEVVGSSPASATIKTPDFDKKSGAFLTFWGKMKHPKKPVGLAVGLAPKKGVLESGVFPTFLQNLFCLLMRLKLSFDMTPCTQDSRNSILVNP